MRIAETLADAGHSVTIICKQADGLPVDAVSGGVRYVRVPMWSRSLLPRVGLLKFSEFESFVRDKVLEIRPTVIHANDLIALQAATRLARQIGAKVVLDIHDLYLHGPKKRTGLAYWHGERVERANIRLADAVITVSNGIAEHLQRLYGIARPAVVLNAPYIPSGSVAGTSRRLRDEIGLAADQPLAVYTGGRSRSRGLDRLVRAMADVEGLHVAMVGHAQSAEDPSLRKIALDGGYADRLHLLPPVPHTLVTSYISSADFGVIPYHVECLNHQYSMPHKLLEAVFAGLPVAVPDLREMRRFVNATETGLVMNALDVADIARAMRTLAAKRKELRLSKDKVWALNEEYGWEVQAATLRSVYDRLYLHRSAPNDQIQAA